jgi:NAD(P)-dependent dehydrogenase (short-subunit alcohol dehydrogenase family)
VAVNYHSSPDRAAEVSAAVQKAGGKSATVQGDVGSEAECRRMVQEASKHLGGLDIIVNNAGWTKPAPLGDLDALTEAEWDRCWDVNTKSNLHLLRAALPIFNANDEGGSFLITSSIAGSIAGGSSMAYSVTKAAGLHMMLCLAETQGPKVRVNAIQPGFLKTEWGLALPEASQQGAITNAKLKQDVSAVNAKKGPVLTAWQTKLDDVVDAFIMAAKVSILSLERSVLTVCAEHVDDRRQDPHR